jgi:hypothetical protein
MTAIPANDHPIEAGGRRATPATMPYAVIPAIDPMTCSVVVVKKNNCKIRTPIDVPRSRNEKILTMARFLRSPYMP